MGVEEVEIVRVNIRNRDPRSGGHVFNSVICGEVKFKPGEVKTLEISEPEAAEIKRNRRRRLGADFRRTDPLDTQPTMTMRKRPSRPHRKHRRWRWPSHRACSIGQRDDNETKPAFPTMCNPNSTSSRSRSSS